MSKPPKLTSFVTVGIVFSVLVGITGSFIEWGEPDEFHGTGLPFAGVYWDPDPDTGRLRDYPNPYAPVMNIATVAIVVVGIQCLVWEIWKARF